MLSMTKVRFSTWHYHRLRWEKYVQKTEKQHEISSSSCWPEQHRKPLHRVSHIRMKLLVLDSVKKAANTTNSGRRFSSCGRKKDGPACIVASPHNLFDKFPTLRSWWQRTRPLFTFYRWSSTPRFILRDDETRARTERVNRIWWKSMKTWTTWRDNLKLKIICGKFYRIFK